MQGGGHLSVWNGLCCLQCIREKEVGVVEDLGTPAALASHFFNFSSLPGRGVVCPAQRRLPRT